MIDISGHLRDVRREIGFEDRTKSFLINCCGYQKFTTQNFSRTRSLGRLDYQLIYIFSGSGIFVLNGKEEVISAGHLLLYPPHVPQIYSYFYKDKPEVYWIHFTGNSVDQILEKFQIHSGHIGIHLQLKNLFQEIIMELQLKKTCFDAVTEALFTKMLALIHRSQTDSKMDSKVGFQLDRLIIFLNQTYQNAWTVKDMAEFCSLSESYFSHHFKEIVGIPPMQYLTELRILKAKDLLLGDDLSISSVASLLGYEDPLYFSKVFKKTTGISPRNYQKNQLRTEDSKN